MAADETKSGAANTTNDEPQTTNSLYTIGHSTRSFDDFVALLAAWKIALVVDVRTVSRSRRNPQYNTEALARDLPPLGIGYLSMSELGGWRKPLPDSLNTAWRVASFRGYADYMQTSAFDDALARLIVLGERQRLAYMCAEAVPWRCHRSLISDALVGRGHPVRHIMTTTRADAHHLAPFAHIEDGRVTYPG